jgi:hypothetical protein
MILEYNGEIKHFPTDFSLKGTKKILNCVLKAEFMDIET